MEDNQINNSSNNQNPRQANEGFATNMSSSEEEARNKFLDLTTKAAIAQNSGDSLSAVNLYLAAYEQVKGFNDDALKNALLGVKKA